MTIIKEIPACQLETIYRIMLKRIGKGYSAEQLSFLIGAPKNYIEAIEASFYTPDDLSRITIALEESNPDSLFSYTDDESVHKIAVIKKEEQGRVTHAYFNVDDEGHEEELFRLYEESFLEFDDMMKSNEISDRITDLIDILVKIGYFFEPKMPAEIFKTINSLHPEPVHSSYIQHALESFCAEGKDKLHMVSSLQDAYCYEER